jgi:hypothetical protein
MGCVGGSAWLWVWVWVCVCVCVRAYRVEGVERGGAVEVGCIVGHLLVYL